MRTCAGPRAAIWEVFLDERSVTIAYTPLGHAGALAQGLEALAAGRAARVERVEFCPACGTGDGVVETVKRGRIYPVKSACRAHVLPWVYDELAECSLISLDGVPRNA